MRSRSRHAELKRLADLFLPAALGRLLQRRFAAVQWKGRYETWKDAQARSGDYGGQAYLSRLEAAVTKVLNGQAAYERDTVAFYDTEVRWPLVGCLLWAASLSGNRLRVLDFGGSLASVYLQHRCVFGDLSDVAWSVVDRDPVVALGRRVYAGRREPVSFYSDLETCIAEQSPATLLVSNTLQYLECPNELLEKASADCFSTLILDNVMLAPNGRSSYIAVQQTRNSIYTAKYPCWFFDPGQIRATLHRHWELVCEWPSDFPVSVPGGHLGGFLFKRRTP
jgi:putative methyltransferase (TIGR04325 family)